MILGPQFYSRQQYFFPTFAISLNRLISGELDSTPKQTDQQAAFEKAISYLSEHWEDGITIEQLQSKMKEFTDSPYTVKWIKQLLANKYRDCIEIIKNVIVFRETAKSILQDYARNVKRTDDINEQKKKAIKLASDLLISDIKCMIGGKENYFSLDDVNSDTMLEYLPESLRYFLSNFTPRGTKRKDLAVAAIGQAVIQLCRNTTLLCPLQTVFGAEIHHQTGSKHLVEVSSKFGFSCSYSEVLNFTQCAAGFEPERSNCVESDIYSADNADVIIETLDGKDTLHVMGMIRSTLCKGSLSHPISRQKPKLDQLLCKMAPLFYFHKSMAKEVDEVFKSFSPEEPKLYVTGKLDLLRISAAVFKPTPRFTGFLKVLTRSNLSSKTHEVEFLPFIDLNPADMSACYTVLEFVIAESKKQAQQAIVTFDQPLWWKAMIIKKTKELTITILLGNFHTQLSFLSSVGYVMKNSGIKGILGTVYEEPTVKKILAGKSYKRAIRAHSLLSTALKKIILNQVLHAVPEGICSMK